MQRTTPLDAFNAAARFTQSALQVPTQKERERNINRINVDNELFDLRITEWMNKNPFVGGNNDAEDREAFKLYREKLRAFIDAEGIRLKGESSSRFYDEQMGYAIKQHYVNAEGKAMQKAENWRTERAFIGVDNFANAEREAVKRGDRTPMAAVFAVVQKLDSLRGDEFNPGIDISPKVEHEFINRFKINIHQIRGTELFNNVTDPAKLRAARAQLNEEFKFMDEETDEIDAATGNKKIKKWTYDKKDEFEEALLQGRCFELWKDRESSSQRKIAAGDINGANEDNRKWRREFDRYYNPANTDVWSDLNTQQLSQGDGWFRDLSGHLKQPGTPSQISKRILLDLYGPEMFIRPQLQGDGTVIVGYYEDGRPITEKYSSIREAMGGFVHYKRAAFFEANKKLELPVVQLMWEKEQSEFFEKFYDEVEKAMKQIDPQLSIDFVNFRKTDTYIKSGSDYFNRDINKMSALERDQYGQRCIQFYESIIFNGITDVPTIRQMMRDFTGGEILNVFGRRPSSSNERTKFNEMKAYSDSVMSGGAEHTVFVLNEPERLRLGLNASNRPQNQVSYGWRDHRLQEGAEAHRIEERGIVAGILGVKPEDLKMGWMASERQQGDVIPKGIFVIGEGANARTVRLNYENNEYKVEELKNKEWVRGESRARQLNRDERRQDSRQAVDTGKNPITREEGFDFTRPSPNRPENALVVNSGFGKLQWLEYSERLYNNPTRVITEAVQNRRNPLNGERLNITAIPQHLRSTMTARTWAGKGPEFVYQAWIKEFEQQFEQLRR